MTAIKVVFNLAEGGWADLHEVNPARPGDTAFKKNVEWIGSDTSDISIGRLRFPSSSSGAVIRVTRKDGSTVLIETSLKCLIEAASVLELLEKSEDETAAALLKAKRAD